MIIHHSQVRSSSLSLSLESSSKMIHFHRCKRTSSPDSRSKSCTAGLLFSDVFVSAIVVFVGLSSQDWITNSRRWLRNQTAFDLEALVTLGMKSKQETTSQANLVWSGWPSKLRVPLSKFLGFLKRLQRFYSPEPSWKELLLNRRLRIGYSG